MQRRALLFAFSTLSAMAAAGCKPKGSASAEPAPLEVDIVRISLADEPRWIEMIGQAEGGGEVEVKSQTDGILKTQRYREGDFVKAGDVMFEIESDVYRARFNAAAAARRRSADELRQAERELKRAEGLFRSGSGSRKALDDARSARNQAKHQLDEARADEADAKIALEWTKVKAPASGYASKALVNPGTLVSADSTVLASVTQHDDVRVVFAPSDRDLEGAELSLNNAVRIFRKDGAELSAKLDYLAQSIDYDVGTRTMRAKIAAGSGVLPGQFVRVRLMVGVDRQACRVPQKAILQLPDGTYCVYIAKEGRAERRPVTVGLWEGRDWIVLSGLKTGDAVITNQLLRLRDGARISVPDAQSTPTESSAS